MDNEDRKWLINLITEIFKIEERRFIKDSALFTDDFGADSLDMVEIMIAIEQKYGVSIPDYEEDKLQTVGGLMKYIEELTLTKAAA